MASDSMNSVPDCMKISLLAQKLKEEQTHKHTYRTVDSQLRNLTVLKKGCYVNSVGNII